jgi:hypothetical protein
MDASQIIAKFELYVDDTTELSSSEELDLLNKVYQRVCEDRPWEFLKKESSGTMTSTTQISLPTDFSYTVENYTYTDNSTQINTNAKPAVVWINTNNPIQFVNWSDRKQYLNNANYCYIDIATSKINFFAAQPSGATYSFDYKAFPDDLDLNDTPVFPARFHDILYHGMCVDDQIIQLFDKARSYAAENQAQYNYYLRMMAQWNSNLINL